MLCIHCLISVFILKLMCYIRRKWHLSKFIKYLFKYTIICKLYKSVSFLYYIYDFALKLSTAKYYLSSYLTLFTWLNKNLPCILPVFKSFKQKHFYGSTCSFLFSDKSGWYNLSIIDNKAVTWLKVFCYIPEYLVFNSPCVFIKHHQP